MARDSRRGNEGKDEPSIGGQSELRENDIV